MSVRQGLTPFLDILQVTIAADRIELPPLYEQLASLPANMTGEIIGGVIPHRRALPAVMDWRGQLSTLESACQSDLKTVRSAGGSFHSTEVHFVPDEEVVVPGLSGWCRECMHTVPGGSAIPDDARLGVRNPVAEQCPQG